MSYYPPTGTSYPYSGYHPPSATAYHNAAHTTGAYPSAYQTPYPPTAVTGYGATWPYAYSYYPPQQTSQATGSTLRPAPAPISTTTQISTAPTTSTTTAPTVSTLAPHSAQRTYSTSTYTYPSYRDSYATSGSRGVGKKSTFRGLFTKELRNLMYGFGDDRNPANDTVNVMEEILVEYIVDVCQTALAPGKKSRLSIEDLRRALSRPADAKKLARMEELLFMQEDIKRARAQFETNDVGQAQASAF